jgi:hypothetical protein
LLEVHLGERWSVAVFSAAERSVAGKRIREFDADTVHALARAFQLPVGFFFLPPDANTVVAPDGASLPPADTAELIALATGVRKPLRDRIDELTSQLPASDRAAILRHFAEDPGGISEGAVLGSPVERMRNELETLTAAISGADE